MISSFGLLFLAIVVTAACSQKATPSPTAGFTSTSAVPTATPSSVQNGVIQVVAGENFWGSIAAQLGGEHAKVSSIIDNPDADPHVYESNPDNARTLADANYVILNGAGYDAWGAKILAASPSASRRVMTVATVLGKKEGDNPHFWYNPDYVTQIADQITADYKSLDPADAAYFDQQRAAFTQALQPYENLLQSIRTQYSGAKVASTESIFVYMADALGLDLVSPPAFMNAMAEDTDPPAQSVAAFHDLITNKQIAVLVFNSQASSPIADNLRQLATSEGIPVVPITETVVPAGASFQDWQVAQLSAIGAALKSSTGSQ